MEDEPPDRGVGGATGQERRAGPASSGRMVLIIAGSLVMGLVVAALLVVAPFIPPTEAGVTGGVLCGLALGWALLVALSGRFTDQPQRWAAAPALLMGLSGLLLVAFGSTAHEVLTWVWPPAVMGLVVWALARVRRELRSAGGRRLLHPVLVVLALAAVGGGYQTVREAVDARDDPMPGQLVDVGGHRLHLACTGSGSPTVVLEPGAGGMSSDLGLISPVIARSTRTCVYDRAGRGWSEPAGTPQDATRIATDLHALLLRGQVPGPYVLAGHSFGGLYALTFAARYPDEVAGMVLLDSTAPASSSRATPQGEPEPAAAPSRLSALGSIAGRIGLGRLLGSPTASHVRSTIEEYLQAPSSMQDAAALRDLGGKPLLVLTAGSGTAAGWSAQQEALATLSARSVHRVVEGADHEALIADQDGAAATSRAILDVVSSVRSTRPLTD